MLSNEPQQSETEDNEATQQGEDVASEPVEETESGGTEVEEEESFNDIPDQELTAKQELKWIQQLRDEQPDLKVNQKWFLLSNQWLKKWKQYCGFDYETGGKPGPVDNTGLVDDPEAEHLVVKKGLTERFDYHFITPKEWKTWIKWYGGGPAIACYAVPSAHYGRPTIETRPLSLQIVRSSDLTTIHRVFYSKATKVGVFRKEVCAKLGLSEDDVRLWDYHADRRLKLLTDPMSRLDEAQIIDNQKVLFEEKLADGKFPKLSGGESSIYDQPTDPGKCGLTNLGNTCFMNSALQCLSNTAPLTKFFLSDKYKEDINRENVLGCKGELAEEYADLLKAMWGGTCRAVAPRDFKWKMERFAPQFSGYQQHDSQELLSFLLDGVNEDLNRIKKKGFTLKRDSAGRLDSVVAAEHWEGYKSRNDSRIVDLFQGQLKSKLVCPECNKVSITFDPFMYLSLPLPIKKTRDILVTLYYFDPSKKATRFRLSVPKNGNIAQLKQQLEKVGSVKAETLEVCDVYHHKFFKIFSDEEGVNKIQERDYIHAYECDPSLSLEDGYVRVAIYNETTESSTYYGSSTIHTRRDTFGLPFFVTVPKKVTIPQLYATTLAQLKNLIKPGQSMVDSSEEEEDEEEENDEEKDDDYSSHSTYGAATTTEAQETAATTTTTAATATAATTTTAAQQNNSEISSEVGEAVDSQIEDTAASVTTTLPTSVTDGDKAVVKEDQSSTNIKLFVFRQYEAYASSEAEPFADSDELKLQNGTKLVIYWKSKTAKFYDKEKAKVVEQHSSVSEEEADKVDAITINKCMELFTVPEKLDPQDAWYCNVCKKHQEATKKFDIWSAPDILVIHLKRFSYRSQYMREKIETFVDFPLVGLDIAKHVLRHTSDTPLLYDCYAITNHFGSLGGGHYTAFAINPLDNKWYQFDDSHVSKTDANSVKTTAAYVLFFRKRGLADESVWDLSPHVTVPSTTTTEVDSTSKDKEEPSEETTDDDLEEEDHVMDQ